MENESSTPTPPPRENPGVPTSAQQHGRETGPVVGIIIIIIVLILGGLYVWGARLSKMDQIADTGSDQTADQILQAPDPALDNLNTQGISDELSAIEDDLDATSLNNLDKELGDVQIELQP